MRGYGIYLSLLMLFGTQARAQEVPEGEASPPAAAVPEHLPSIIYGATRESSQWIETPAGLSVAVDQGVAWEGVTYYISLTSDLLAVAEGSEGATWQVSVSPYWSQLAIERVQIDGEQILALALRPGARSPTEEGRPARKVEYRSLDSGAKLASPGAEPDLGESFTPRLAASGDSSQQSRGFKALVTSADSLNELARRLFGEGTSPDFGNIDFANEVVLAISYGDHSNCTGLSCLEAFENDKRVLVRMAGLYYQSAAVWEDQSEEGTDAEPAQQPPEAKPVERPYGIWVLPRREGKAYVVEKNGQSFIGGPPLWNPYWEQPSLPDPARELDAVPAAPTAR